MDIRCKNCGQMIDENDKYCKYCGYLIPQKVKEVPLSKQKMDDKLQEMKATISLDEIGEASLFDNKNLVVKYVGEKKSIYAKNVAITILSFLIAIICLAVAITMKSVDINKTVALCVLCLGMFFMLGAFGITVERYMNTKSIKNLKEDKISVRKYGFKKPAEFLYNNHIFMVDVACPCPKCEGEIIGDLHIEMIEKNPIVVCNINRKHYWIIDEEALIKGVKDGSIAVLDKKKK